MTDEKRTDVIIHASPPKEKNPHVIIGFPGSGLVGSIALAYLIDQLEFAEIGWITSRFFPPMAMMGNGIINIPVRIYEREGLIAILADIPVPPSICYEVADAIIDWIQPFEVSAVINLAGLITNENEKRLFCVATTTEMLEKIGDMAFVLPIGSISGIAASILIECKTRGIPALGLMGETINAPDPRAAASIVDLVNKLFSLGIDLEPLYEQAEEIESSMHQLAAEIESAEEDTIMKRENLPMYG
ncbi:MAG: proteasome assembly chaperone family protein [Methanospirillaceae archaeon]|nr:proteasome assembly chaperone family protein [Methanospirillaceae archaeon]